MGHGAGVEGLEGPGESQKTHVCVHREALRGRGLRSRWCAGTKYYTGAALGSGVWLCLVERVRGLCATAVSAYRLWRLTGERIREIACAPTRYRIRV